MYLMLILRFEFPFHSFIHSFNYCTHLIKGKGFQIGNGQVIFSGFLHKWVSNTFMIFCVFYSTKYSLVSSDYADTVTTVQFPGYFHGPLFDYVHIDRFQFAYAPVEKNGAGGPNHARRGSLGVGRYSKLIYFVVWQAYIQGKLGLRYNFPS